MLVAEHGFVGPREPGNMLTKLFIYHYTCMISEKLNIVFVTISLKHNSAAHKDIEAEIEIWQFD